MKRSMFVKSEKGQGSIELALGIVGVIVVVAIVWAVISLRRVDPGNAGVLVDYGKGSQNNQASYTNIPTGQFVWINPATQRLAEYNISQQTLTMVRANGEGQVVGDDSVRCNDVNGVPLNLDSSTLWRVNSTEVGQLYMLRPDVPLSGSEGSDISSLIVRREVRNAITIVCGTMRYDEIFGAKRVEFGLKVTEILSVSLEKSYLMLDGFLLGEVHLEQQQQEAINRKVVAEQAAQEAAFLKQKAENEAAAQIAAAEGQRQVAILQAQAQAEAIRIINEQLANSPDYLVYYQITQWDGALPTTLVTSDGQTIPLIQVPSGTIVNPTPVPTEITK